MNKNSLDIIAVVIIVSTMIVIIVMTEYLRHANLTATKIELSALQRKYEFNVPLKKLKHCNNY